MLDEISAGITVIDEEPVAYIEAAIWYKHAVLKKL